MRNFSGFVKGFGSPNKDLHPLLPQIPFFESLLREEGIFWTSAMECVYSSFSIAQRNSLQTPNQLNIPNLLLSHIIPLLSVSWLGIRPWIVHFSLFNFSTSSFSSRIPSVNTKKFWLSCLIYPSPHLDFISWSQFQVLMLRYWFKYLIYPPLPPPITSCYGFEMLILIIKVLRPQCFLC